MLFDFNFYSSILLIFFVHAVIYSVILLRKGFKNESKPEKYLACILFLCALYICPWMLGFAGWYWDGNMFYKNILFYFPFQQMLFIGPLIYFYIQSILNPAFSFTKKRSLHFIPGALYFLFSLWMMIYDVFINKKVYYYADGSDREFDFWYQSLSIISVTIYLFLSYRFYYNYKKIIFHITSNAYTIQYNWILLFLTSFSLYLILFISFSLYNELVQELNYKQYWWYYLIFSISTYYIAINGYSNAITNKVPFNLIHLKNKLQLQLQYDNTNNETIIDDVDVIVMDNKPTQEIEIEEWKQKIKDALLNQKLYENEELNLPELAKKLNTNPTILSKAINKGFLMNFNDLINFYRINAVIDLLKKGEQKKQTLLSIAYECGFNSKATFNRAFKKVHHLSPKEWLEKNNL